MTRALSSAEKTGGLGSRLSFGQERLWFLDRLAPGSDFYNLSATFALSGPIDAVALSRAVRSLSLRHEVLRSVFRDEQGGPVQIVRREPIELEISDLPEDPVRGRAELARWLNQPFDLTAGPVLRARLGRVRPDKHVLAVAAHHIVADSWSFGVLSSDLSSLYADFAAGRAPSLAPLPLQYSQYAQRQRRRLDGERRAAEQEHWKAKLDGAPTVLDLPTDRPRPKVASFRGASVPISLDPRLARGIRGLGRRERASVFMVLLAAFEVLLARWCGQPDLLIGIPVAGRDEAELEGLIGFFINTLPLRADLSGDPTFAESLRRARAACLDALAHADMPFDAVVEALAPERDPGRNPLVQVAFQLDNTPDTPLTLLGAEEQRGDGGEWNVPEAATSTRFDLALKLIDGGDGIHGEFTYSTDLFEASTIERLAQRFRRLVEVVVADPGLSVSALAPRALGDSSFELPTAPVARREQTIDAMFVRQALRTPSAVALSRGEARVTYRRLLEDANRLARWLRSVGVRPETTVAVCLPPGPDQITAILATLIAGGGYVPVADDLPEERARRIVCDCGATAVIGLAARIERLALGTGIAALRLDSDAERFAALSPARLPSVTTPHHLAQVLYTSGSTGGPKGVMVRHGHITEYVRWCLANLPIAEHGAVPLVTSLSFAGETLAFFGSLLSGRRLVLPEPRDPWSWAQGEPEFDFVKLTPSTLKLLDYRFGRCWDRWSCMILASEPVCAQVLELATAPGLARVVDYGTTETNAATSWCVDSDAAPDPDSVRMPVGTALSTAQVLVLDPWGDPVPPGAPGEVYIGGAHLARGYLGQPGLTAERFVPNPFGPPGSRLFRTGDLARWDEGDRLVFLGRTDDQVKIRGFRVELEEVERALAGLPGVSAAAVQARGDSQGGQMLVAFVVLEAVGGLTVDELRSGLERRLAHYMVPSRFAVLPDLPLTTGGKLDRSALAAMRIASPENAGQEAARPGTEQAVAAIWHEVLPDAQPRRDDDFFAIGGHSLLAIQVLTRVRRELGPDLPIHTLFEAPTLAEFARTVDEALRGAADDVDRLVEEVAALSDEEVARMLADSDPGA